MAIETMKMMTKQRVHRPAKLTGARALLLAMALSGTIVGWTVLANSAPKGNALAATAPALTTKAIVPAAQQGADTLLLAPIPTIQSPPTSPTLSTTLQPLPEPARLIQIPAVPSLTNRRPVARARSSR